MKNLINTLYERRIWRVLIAYPSVTFIWLQVVEFFINNYDFDPRWLTVSLITAILLFPAARTLPETHEPARVLAVLPFDGKRMIFGGFEIILEL